MINEAKGKFKKKKKQKKKKKFKRILSPLNKP